MKEVVYPVVFEETKDKVPFYVYVPDLDVSTQGKNQADAIHMARDLINLTIVELEDSGQVVPEPGSVSYTLQNSEFISLVDAAPEKYRTYLKNLSVKKNCTIPKYLCDMAEKAGINFSKVLQEALMEKLNLT